MNQREKNPENGHRRMVVSTVVIVVVLAVIVALAAVFIPRMRSNSSASGSSSQSQSQQSGSSSSDSKKQANTNSNSSQSGTVTMIDPSQKTLILYFSLTGTTQQAAESIHRLLPNADIVRIQPKEAYGDYDAAARRGDRERRNNIHPVPNIESYQNIFLGFPTWWQQPPMLIHTLFDNYDFSGKTIIPFTTSSSSPMSTSMPTMRQLAQKDNAKIVDGFRWDGDDAALRSWLRGMKAVN